MPRGDATSISGAGEKRGLTDVSALDPGLLPRIVIVIDEFAGLMEDKAAKRAMNELLKQIGAMARAVGIHLILATPET